MQEKQLEQMLQKAVRQAGGKALKLVSPGWSGAPDRLIILPDGKHGFIETKTPGNTPRPLQQQRLQWLQNLGHYATWINNPNQIHHTIQEIQTHTPHTTPWQPHR